MNKLDRWWMQMDQAIFKQIKLLKSSPKYAEAIGKLDFLSYSQSKAIFQLISYATIALPLPLVLFIFLKNADLKNELDIKRQISAAVQSYKKGKMEIGNLERTLIAQESLKSRNVLEKKISQSFDEKKNFSIVKFDSQSITGSLKKTNITLSFNNLSTKSLFSFLGNLSSRQKVKITLLDIKRDEKTKTIGGQLQLVQFHKADKK